MAPSLQAPFPIPPDPIITNFISMDIVANTLFSAGACPTMLHAIEELPDFTPCIAALVLNVGTLSPSWLPAMKPLHAYARRSTYRGVYFVLGRSIVIGPSDFE
ncbi:hypothetical protein JHK84_055614 [Glycine max]|nr:hypothetical protein JHK84_055614 [Glycine max]